MKIFTYIFGTIIISSLVLSCGGNGQTNNDKPTKEETPKVLQDDKLEIESYSRSVDLTEELYQDLVDKTPELKKFEADLNALTLKPNELKEAFNKYDIKSNGYYNSATYKATSISDSLLRMKITAFITTSSKEYAKKTAELNSLLKQISNNSSSINDKHTILKIMLTLPLIEKYQVDNLPNKKEFNNLINKQEKLILKADSLTPKH